MLTMLTLIRKLYRTGLLTPHGALRLLGAVTTTGVNLMAVLRVAAGLHPLRTAVVDERVRLTYTELWHQAESVAAALHADRGVRAGQRVAVACRNHAAAVKAIFACSRLGAHVYLINPEMSADQMLALEARLRSDLFIHDAHSAGVFDRPPLNGKALPSYHPTGESIDRMALRPARAGVRLKKVRAGDVVVMTGGTTGQPKAAARRPSVFNFLPPFAALLIRVHLDRHDPAYLATPIYHGFGLASLLVGVILGKEMHFTERFDAEQACALIAQNRVEVVTLVPLMLQRMLRADPGSLSSLRCVVSGGAALSPALAGAALGRLGPVLFNLYGTSEAGFCVMATPDVLSRKPGSIGRPVGGVRVGIVDESGEVAEGTTGRLCIRSAWTTSRKGWVETGDLACRDAEGDLFLCGRTDDMVVSGGENVYPVELEHVLLQHPGVESAAVVGIPDAEFGQRLKAVVVRKCGVPPDRPALLEWLRPRVARYQMPSVVEFRDELPYTPLGKLDRRALRSEGPNSLDGITGEAARSGPAG
jgi:acyl-CoA synthetase (AMP-forming)/AMP-acid ligase II